MRCAASTRPAPGPISTRSSAPSGAMAPRCCLPACLRRAAWARIMCAPSRASIPTLPTSMGSSSTPSSSKAWRWIPSSTSMMACIPTRAALPRSPKTFSRPWSSSLSEHAPSTQQRRKVEMPRLFTAIEIPATIRQPLSLIRAPLSGAKWIEPENMHITLRFAGDLDGRTADEFAQTLAGVCATPLPVMIAGVGAFGGRDPRVLWAGVETSEGLNALYRANDRAARAAGLEPVERNFRPHVTLARLRGARHQLVARFLTENGSLRHAPFLATRFVLLSARSGSGGAPYVVEAEYPLASTG